MWTLIQYDWYLYKRRNFGHRDMHTGKVMWRDAGRRWRLQGTKRHLGQIISSQSSEEPALPTPWLRLLASSCRLCHPGCVSLYVSPREAIHMEIGMRQVELRACTEESMNKAEGIGRGHTRNPREEGFELNLVGKWHFKNTFEKESGVLESSSVRATTKAWNYYSGLLL